MHNRITNVNEQSTENVSGRKYFSVNLYENITALKSIKRSHERRGALFYSSVKCTGALHRWIKQRRVADGNVQQCKENKKATRAHEKIPGVCKIRTQLSFKSMLFVINSGMKQCKENGSHMYNSWQLVHLC